MLALMAATTPAQDLPPVQPAKPVAKPAFLSESQLAIWTCWIRGDMKGVYTNSQSFLEAGAYTENEFEATVAMQAQAANELGWHTAHTADLRSLIDIAGEDRAPRLRWELIQRLKHTGRLEGIDEQVDKLGTLKNWWVCGPFTNDRGQGFEDVQPPEETLSLDVEFTGKEGQQVVFRPMPAKTLDGSVNLGAMLRPNTEATAFLVTAVHRESEPAWADLSLGSTEDVKVWQAGLVTVDQDGEPLESDSPLGVPVIEARDEHPLGFDQGRATIPLQKGWTVIVAKVGNGETDWEFLARLDQPNEWREAQGREELAEALAGISPFRPEVQESDGDPRFPEYTSDAHGYFFATARELLNPRRDSTSTLPRRLMEDALEQAEAAFDVEAEGEADVRAHEMAVFYYLAAWANRSTARYSAGREENRRRELLRQCFELDPQAARAAYELSQYYTTTFGNPTLAHDYAKAAVKANPRWIEARIYASRVVAMKGLDMEVERELASLLQEYPENASVLRFSAYYAGLRRDYKLSNDLFAKALKADFVDPYSRARLLERAVARGDMKEALKHAADTRKLDPFDTSAATQLAEMFMFGEKYSLAERELNKALEIAPRDDDLFEKLGQLYSAWADASEGDKADELRRKSVNAYVAALDANPRREDIERYLEYLEGEQPPFEAALQEDISGRIQAALQAEVDSDNPYEVIYRDQVVVVNDDGTTSQYMQEALRVTNDNGRDWLQRLPVPAWGDQQGRCVHACVWRADGDVEEGRRSRWSASFPPLDIGDIVHVRFRVTDSEQSFFGDFYGAREVFRDYVPVHEVRYAWVLPPGRKFYDYRTGDAPNRTISSVNGRTVWQYRAKDLPKLHDEPLAPPPHQRSATVQISTYENWQEFGRWYYNLIRKQMESTPEMTAKVNELIATATTEKEKARAVYNWVVTHVRYNADWHFGVHGYKPFSAGAVFARCIGDCKDKAILICTMLGIAGVKAYPVIINLESFRGEEDITLPMPNHFNHAIAYVEFSDGQGLFVDGTTTYNGIDELSAADRGANVIIVRPEGGERTQIPWGTAESDSRSDEIEAEFAGNGVLKLKVTRTAVGDSASMVRARYQREGDRKKSLEREWAEHYPGAKVSDVATSDLSNLDEPPTISFTVELPNAYTNKEGKIELITGLDPREWTQTEFAGLTTRKTALLTPAPYQRKTVTRFKLPQGYRAARLPDALNIDHPNVRLRVSAESKDGVLTVTREYAMLGGTIQPSDYSEFRRKLIQYDSAEAATIRLTK